MIYNIVGSDGTCGDYNYNDYDDYINTTNNLNNLGEALKEYYENIQEILKLLYKNWLTNKEWLMELHIINVYKSLKKGTGIIYKYFHYKTVKSLSPIVRNHIKGRK